MGKLKTWQELKAKSDELRFDFLRIDLGLCTTYVDLVHTKLRAGDRPAAERVFAKAAKGYETIARFLADVQNPEEHSEISEKLGTLCAALEFAHQLLYPPPLEAVTG